jgi:Ca2+-binding EF-hand superfamily protein
MAMAISAPLYAAPESGEPSPANRAFQKLDTNRDGYISRDEAARLRNFGKASDEADDNHDGKLERDEFVNAQAKMPRDMVIKLNTEIVRVLKHGEIAERFYQQGVEPVSSTPEEYAASNVKSEYTRWGEVVKKSGITAD